MAIYEVTDTDVLQVCAKCETENRIPQSALQAGLSHAVGGNLLDERQVLLPPCTTCKSQEVLFRSELNEPAYPAPGSFGHLHRLLVDHLHSELVRTNRVVRELKDAGGRANQKIAKAIRQADRDKYFPGGLKIERAGAGGLSPGPGPGPAPAPGQPKGTQPPSDPGPGPTPVIE